MGLPAIPTLADVRPPPATYSWLPGFGLYVPASDLEVPAVFVALDTPVPDRLGEARTIAERLGPHRDRSSPGRALRRRHVFNTPWQPPDNRMAIA
jgi:hypothetical protein